MGLCDEQSFITCAVLKPAQIPAADRGGGNRTIPLVSRGVGSEQMLNGITIIAPGSAIPLHYHNCEESVIVLEGHGFAEVGGKTHEVAVHDTTWIPANVPHCFRNGSIGKELKIFCTYASADATRTLVTTGETRSVSSEHNRLA